MRIISGTYGGRVLRPPKGLPVRPTTDRTKEALFNTLQHRLDWAETEVCDLFSGTGNIAIECVSRGAKSVLAVEQNPRCVKAIERMADDLGIQHLAIRQADVFRFVVQEQALFDFIFMDPPYDMAKQDHLIDQLVSTRLRDEESLLVVEHRTQYDFSHLLGFEQVRKYGSSSLSFFGKNE